MALYNPETEEVSGDWVKWDDEYLYCSQCGEKLVREDKPAIYSRRTGKVSHYQRRILCIRYYVSDDTFHDSWEVKRKEPRKKIFGLV